MGMDAKVDIWVGVKYDGEGGVDRDEFLASLPRSLFDEHGDLIWREADMVNATGGIHLEEFQTCDDDVGFGIAVLTHDWDYGIIDFDVQKLASEIAEAKDKATEFFTKHGITHPVRVLLASDYR